MILELILFIVATLESFIQITFIIWLARFYSKSSKLEDVGNLFDIEFYMF